MKRYIKSAVSSKFRIKGSNLMRKLCDTLKQLMPKNCYPSLNLRHDTINLEKCPSEQRLVKSLIKSLELLGYESYEINYDGYDVAIIDNTDSYALFSVFVDKFYDTDDAIHPSASVSIKYGDGRASIQDWYRSWSG